MTPLSRLLAAAFISRVLSTEAVARAARPSYPSIRYDEDWSALRDRSLHDDVWDRVKYLPLRWPNCVRHELRIRAGRQELAFGKVTPHG